MRYAMLLALALSACGGPDDPNPDPDDAGSPDAGQTVDAGYVLDCSGLAGEVFKCCMHPTVFCPPMK